jgi:predicted ATPase
VDQLRNSYFLQLLCTLHAKHACRRSCRAQALLVKRRIPYHPIVVVVELTAVTRLEQRSVLSDEQNWRETFCRSLQPKQNHEAADSRRLELTLRRRFERTEHIVKGYEVRLILLRA